ncbi:MAG: tRNA (cytidine(56)-2'-O)-methyltransferase, partial [Thermoplasmata archaeon]
TQFGGQFEIEFEPKWRNFVSSWKNKGPVIHLTMYGEHIDTVISGIQALPGNLLIVVGAEKVPRDIYDIADYNIAIGNQPHSEIAALAVFLDRLYEGRMLQRKFDGQMTIEPNPRGKSVRLKNDIK